MLQTLTAVKLGGGNHTRAVTDSLRSHRQASARRGTAPLSEPSPHPHLLLRRRNEEATVRVQKVCGRRQQKKVGGVDAFNLPLAPVSVLRTTKCEIMRCY